jgi:hypothetical protein
LGFAAYYRRFIPNFSRRAAVLFKLLRKDAVWTWTTIQETVFEDLRQALSHEPVLHHFMDDYPVIVHTDASNDGLGAVLVQRHPNGNEHVIAYASRRLTDIEQRRHSTELECMAVVWALEQFRPYVHGRKFTVVTDSNAVQYILSKPYPSPKLLRWALELQEYTFDVLHRKGDLHTDADFLSRLSASNTTAIQLATLSCLEPSAIRLAQRNHPPTAEIIRVLSSTESSLPPRDRQARSEFSNKYELIDGLVHRRHTGRSRAALLFIPPENRVTIVSMCHDGDSGHPGIRRTIGRVAERFYWPNIGKIAQDYVQSCSICQRRKASQRKPEGKLVPITASQAPFEMIGIDFLGPLQNGSRGRKYVIVAVDYHTRYVEASAVTSARTGTVISFLRRLIERYGRFLQIITDRAQCYQSKAFQRFLRQNNMQHTMTSALHPQSNGLVERTIRTLTETLHCMQKDAERPWTDLVGKACFAINTSIQSSLEYTPYELLYGRLAILPGEQENIRSIPVDPVAVAEMRANAQQNLKRSQAKQKAYHDLKHAEATRYSIGQKVLVRRVIRRTGQSDKFQDKFIGPFTVQRRLQDTTYQIRDQRNNRVFSAHCSLLKPFVERVEDTTGR